jgi:hypothetical protein
LAVVAVLATRGQAADRTAATTTAATATAAAATAVTAAANPMADITDLYAWMTGSSLNMVMDVSPRDDGSHGFSPSVVYVFHVTSKDGIGIGRPSGTETQVICRFETSTSVQCWVASDGTIKDYVTGDPSTKAGVTSVLGKIKVFAGRRSDPAFFNQTGFTTGMATLAGKLGGSVDGAGCPTALDSSDTQVVRTQFATGSDDFAAANVMAIVVQIDKAMVATTSMSVVGVWGATHAGG